MEDFKCKNFDLSIGDSGLEDRISFLNQDFRSEQKNKAGLCYRLYDLQKYLTQKGKELTSWFGSQSVIKILEEFYGLEKATIYRLINCYKKFCNPCSESYDVATVSFKPEFYGFSISKLFEMLPVSESTLILDLESGQLNSDMTVKDIRTYVKNLKSNSLVSKVSEIDKENIEEESEKIEVLSEEDLKKKTKAELIDIINYLYSFIKK